MCMASPQSNHQKINLKIYSEKKIKRTRMLQLENNSLNVKESSNGETEKCQDRQKTKSKWQT